MDAPALDKELLIERIRQTDDLPLLLEIQALLDEARGAPYSDTELANINEQIRLGLADAEAGWLVPHEVVMKALQDRGTKA